MMRFVASISLFVVLGACSGGKPEEKPAAPKGEADAGAKAPLSEAEAKERAAMKTIIDAKEAEAKVREDAKAVLTAEPPAAPAAAVAATPTLEPFEADGGRYGYRTAAGEVVIPAKYAMAMPFVDKVAAVVGDDGWVFIDRTGKELAKAFVFDNGADEFVDGRARIVEGEKHGFLASTGEIVVPPTWSFAAPFSGGYAAVCEGCKREEMGEHFMMTGGTWGYVDVAGKVVIPPRFEEAGPFTDGRATVKESGRELVIGPDGAALK